MEHKEPLVSVVIPAYNNAAFIAEALDSVFAQTYTNIEIIVVDDGSTDATENVLKPYRSKVTYLKIDNGGSARARNIGIQNAQGDYIAFLDADDIWLPEKIKNQMAVLNEKPDIALVYCGKTWITADGEPLDPGYTQTSFPSGDIFVELFKNNLISTTSVVVARKECLHSVGGFDESAKFKNSQDYDLWLRVAAKYVIAGMPEKLVKYRVHGSNRTKDIASRFIGHEAAITKAITSPYWAKMDNKSRRLIMNDKLRNMYHSYGNTFFYIKEYPKARKALAMAIRYSTHGLNVSDCTKLILTFIPVPWLNQLRSLVRWIKIN